MEEEPLINDTESSLTSSCEDIPPHQRLKHHHHHQPAPLVVKLPVLTSSSCQTDFFPLQDKNSHTAKQTVTPQPSRGGATSDQVSPHHPPPSSTLTGPHHSGIGGPGARMSTTRSHEGMPNSTGDVTPSYHHNTCITTDSGSEHKPKEHSAPASSSSHNLNQHNHHQNQHSRISLENIECVESSDNQQEWAFTLYNIDGQSQITQQDLSSLLASLYKAVGSSIILPHSGAKTIKLRLTLLPEDSTSPSTTPSSSSPDTAQPDPTSCHASSAPPKCSRPFSAKRYQISSARSNKNNKTRESSSRQQQQQPGQQQQQPGQQQQQPGQQQQQQSGQQATNADDKTAGQHSDKHVTFRSESPTPAFEPPKSRLSQVEHKQLVDLIQKNMERQQHHHQKLLRRQSNDHKPHRRSKPSRPRSGAGSGRRLHTETPLHHSADASPRREKPKCGESVDRRIYYQDLAGIDSAKLPENKPTGSKNTINVHDAYHVGGPCKVETENSVDAGSHCNRVLPGVEYHHHSTSVPYERLAEQQAEDSSCSSSGDSDMFRPLLDDVSSIKQRPVSCTLADLNATPRSGGNDNHHQHHYRRHRHRERNRKQAMRDVAEWIQQMHNWNQTPETTGPSEERVQPPEGNGAENKQQSGERTNRKSTSSGANGNGSQSKAKGDTDKHVVVQKHEHHHIHTHHHHYHYHHYNET